jgi:LysM repeat protein
MTTPLLFPNRPALGRATRTGPPGRALEIASMSRIRLACCALLLAGVAHAGIEKAGTTSGNFLSVGTGAAILSMGGATLGSGHDLNAAAWNPGALGGLQSLQYSLSHAELSGSSTQDWLAAGGRFGQGRTRWAFNALYENDGSFDGRDAFGNPTGSFKASSMALGAQLARPLGDVATAGLGVRWVNDALGDVTGSAFGVDAGVLARFGAFGIGAAARNLGTKMNYTGGSSYDLPAVYGAGASWNDEQHGLRLALDANFPSAYYNDLRMGGEWRWKERLALRAGYRLELGAAANEPLGGPSFGVGGGANGLWVDYGFHAGASQAQGQHRLGLTFWPGFLNRGIEPVGDATPGDAPRAPATASRTESPKSQPTAKSTAAAEPVAAAPKAKRAAKEKPVAAAPAPIAASVNLPEADVHSNDVAPRASTSRDASSDRTAALAPSARVSVPVMAAPVPVAVAKPAAAAPRPAAGAPKSAAAAPKLTAATPKLATATPKAAANTVPASKPVAVHESAAPASVPPAPVTTNAAPSSPPAPVAAPAPDARVASSAPRVEVVVKPIPEPEAAPAKPSKPEKRPESVSVKGRESLADIAKRWDTSVPALMMENDLVSDKVRPGQRLKLPAAINKK